jgi:DNA-directed RNA polymerase beta' subunit
MNSTERKLDEAKYFLNQLNINDPYFDYNLSAYLNSARSIMWIMRYEYNKTDGWNEWFNGYQLSEKSNNLLKAINELRIKAVKQSGVQTDFYILSDLLIKEEYYSEIKKLLAEPDGDYVLSIEPVDKGDRKDEEKNQPNDNIIASFIATVDRAKTKKVDSREEILWLCQKYLTIVQEIVAACITLFPHHVR